MGRRRKHKLVFGKDYTYENGKCVLTREYLLTLGECCNNNCPHCPYKTPGANGAAVSGGSNRGGRLTARTAR
jgi:hypothetical protein